nr:RNA-directed DNA polymerase, eukaryota [Tanacetum cinerariifolium]
NDQDAIQPLNENETSNDPFNIYDLLKKHDKGEVNSRLDTSFPYPPGFTPEKDNLNIDVQKVKGTDQAKSQSRSEGLCSRIMEETRSLEEHISSEIRVNGHEQKKAVLSWRSSRCFLMNCLSLNIQDLGSKDKKEWIRELNIKHKVNFLTLQETKMDSISAMDVKLLWGNYNFDHVFSEAVTTGKRSLLSYIMYLVTHCNGDCMVMGDFNEVRCMEDRRGSVFNVQGANEFNNFISNSGLVEVQLEGYSFTWSHLSATKMSKLDRFLVTKGLISLFPHISGICLDKHLSDHRPFLLREVITDYGAMPFWMYHSWFSLHGFEQMVTHTWNSIVLYDGILEKGDSGVGHGPKTKTVRTFQAPGVNRSRLNFRFHNRLNPDQVPELEILITRDEIRMASILINGNPTSEFQFYCGLKQGDPLAPYLFILIMESLYLLFSRAVNAGIFTGIKIDSSLTISHLFSADDAVFIGHLLGVGTSNDTITAAALNLGCSVMKTQFKYFGVMVGGNSSTIKAWDDTIGKLKAHLSNWKLKTLSIGGRLTLLKSVLRSSPIYNMSLYKVPKSVLHLMESIRRNFFNGIQGDERKITWVKWSKVLAPKKYGDLISHCKIRVGNGMRTQFQNDTWVGDTQLRYMFPRIYALEVNKVCTVADKLQGSVALSLQRTVRGGVEAHQLDLLQNLIGPTILTNLEDRWVWDLNGEGVFHVKDLRNLLDESFLPKDTTATRWVKSIPIKINVIAWKVYLDRLPTRLNLIRRGVQVPSLSCPVCNAAYEDMSHLLSSCDLANDVVRLVCRWWNLTWSPLGSYSEWLSWFNSIRYSYFSKP